MIFVFFFKQKTAYEIYQCDWSSDVCSSDLNLLHSLLELVRVVSSGADGDHVKLQRCTDVFIAELLRFSNSLQQFFISHLISNINGNGDRKSVV